MATLPTPHKCTSSLWRGPHGISGAGLPLFNLFKKNKTIHNSFHAPIEREHELFLNSSHFDILLYLNGFVIWHCVLCILVYFFLFGSFFWGGAGVCYSSALFLFFFLLVVSEAVCDCLIAIRILELEHSSSVNGTLQISGCERVGYVLAQPPAEGHSLTVIAIMWHVQILYFIFFFF